MQLLPASCHDIMAHPGMCMKDTYEQFETIYEKIRHMGFFCENLVCYMYIYLKNTATELIFLQV